eukprot:95891_1
MTDIISIYINNHGLIICHEFSSRKLPYITQMSGGFFAAYPKNKCVATANSYSMNAIKLKQLDAVNRIGPFYWKRAILAAYFNDDSFVTTNPFIEYGKLKIKKRIQRQLRIFNMENIATELPTDTLYALSWKQRYNKTLINHIIHSTHSNIYGVHLWDNSWLYNEWSINWTLIETSGKGFYENLLSQNDYDISHIISWKPSHSPKLFCGSQYFPQTLYVRNDNIKYRYMQIHDIVLQTDQKSIWIFIVNYGFKTSYTKRYFHAIVSKHKHMICAFNDGSTMLSHAITDVKYTTKTSWYAVVECDIPSHLITFIVNSNKYSNVSVSIINPTSIRKSDTYINSIQNIPICSTWTINNFDHITDIESLSGNSTINYYPKLWNSLGYENYKYNLTACTIIQPIEMEYHSLNYGKYDQTMFILRDWIEYNFGILGIQHFIIYQHFLPNETIANLTMQQSIIFKILYPYIKLNIVTYIPWYNELMVERVWQNSMENSCLKRFGHTKFSKYLMFVDVDEYIIPHSKYQQLKLLDLINDSENNNIFQFQVFCKKAFSCAEDMICSMNNKFNTVFARHACIADYDYSGLVLRKQIVEALKVKLMYTHWVEMFVDNSTGSNHTMNISNVVCLHAKSNILIINDGVITFSHVHRLKDIDQMTVTFTDYMKHHSIAKQETKLLPLYKNDSEYCKP